MDGQSVIGRVEPGDRVNGTPLTAIALLSSAPAVSDCVKDIRLVIDHRASIAIG